MKILIAEDNAGALQLLQNVRIDLCDRTGWCPILFSNDQELQPRLIMSHRPKRRGLKS